MNRQEALRLLEESLDETPDSLDEAMALENLESWDSMGILKAIVDFDAQLNVVLEPEELAKCKTVANILDLIATSSEASNSP